MQFRNRYSAPHKVKVQFTTPGRTKQSHKDECDINYIMARFNKTGQLPDMIKRNPQYGDFSNPLTYQESQNVVIHAQTQFASLSAKVRERFGNNPQKFLEFAVDPKNGEEMVRLGLAKKREPEAKPEGLKTKPEVEKKSSKTSDKTEVGGTK